MRQLIRQPRSLAADSIWTAVTIWKWAAIPIVFLAVASAFHATNKIEPILLFGGFYVASGIMGAGCCWLKSVPSWLIYWYRTRR